MAALELFEEEARSILSRNESPDVPFVWSLNPYRGCFHACAYCYARPTHQYLGFGAGTDFDRKIVVKTNAPELLARKLASRSWKGELISFSGNTDCYQPAEASYELTRRCLEVCVEFRNPVSIITKGALIQRDVDVLAKLAERTSVRAYLSIPFLDEKRCRLIEPTASPPSKRFESIARLAEAGVPTGVAVAPIIPGLNDSDVAEILERARDAGARHAFPILLRLAPDVAQVFWERVHDALPERAGKIESALRQMRGGRTNDSRFGTRMSGSGPRWDILSQMFETQCRRLGLRTSEDLEELVADRPPEERQGELF